MLLGGCKLVTGQHPVSETGMCDRLDSLDGALTRPAQALNQGKSVAPESIVGVRQNPENLGDGL
jgi:hypothetical protein